MPELPTIRGKNFHPDLARDSALTAHINDSNNPHNVTTQQVIDLLVSGRINEEFLSDYFNSPHGIAQLNEFGKLPDSLFPSSIVDGMTYRGVYDASLNRRPDFPDFDASNGDFWIVSVAGTWNGINWQVGDFVIFQGDPINDFAQVGSSSVYSVNGQQGVVSLESDDIPFNSVEEPGVSTYDKIKEIMFNMNYFEPSVTLTGGGLYEQGFTISNPLVSWTTNVYETITTQTLTDRGTISPVVTVGNYTFTGANLTTNKTYTMNITDNYSNTNSSSTNFVFTNKRAWGMDEESLIGKTDGYITSFVLSKLTSELASNRNKGNVTFTPSNWPISTPDSNTKFAYFAFPQSWGLPTGNKLKVNGFDTIFEVITVNGYQNQYGVTVPYYVMKSPFAFASPVTITLA